MDAKIDIAMLKLAKEELEAEKLRLETEIEAAPGGMPVRYITKDGRDLWYRQYKDETGKRRRQYLPKKEEDTVAALSMKLYHSKALSDVKAKLKGINSLLYWYPEEDSTDALFADGSPYLPYLESVRAPKEELDAWAHADYERSTYHPEHLTHPIGDGRFVRSKSEALIVSELEAAKIPYRYECLTYIEGKKRFPDFTIKHPKTGEIYYWEHLGQIDVESYHKNLPNRIMTYIHSGFYPQDRLILTCETSTHPLSLVKVRAVIAEYFL